MQESDELRIDQLEPGTTYEVVSSAWLGAFVGILAMKTGERVRILVNGLNRYVEWREREWLVNNAEKSQVSNVRFRPAEGAA